MLRDIQTGFFLICSIIRIDAFTPLIYNMFILFKEA